MRHNFEGKHYNKSNIFLIAVDALRTDHLSCYGYHKLTSPNLDIFPTVLDILNIKPRHHLSGVSLLPFINDENITSEKVVLSEGEGVQGISVGAYIPRIYSLRTPQWKYINNVTQNKKELYQLKNDPLELKNLANETYVQNIVKDFDSQIDDLLDSAAKFKKKKLPVEVEKEIIERLKALGYM